MRTPTLPRSAQGARNPSSYIPPPTNNSSNPRARQYPLTNTRNNYNPRPSTSGTGVNPRSRLSPRTPVNNVPRGASSAPGPTVGDLNLPRTNPTYRPPPGPPPATYGNKGIPANSYNHPQASAFQPPQAPRGRFDPPPPYGSSTRPNLPRPAIAPRPRAIPRAAGRLPRATGGRAIAGGAGAIAGGAITAGSVLAAGGSVPEAVGAGVGAGVGSAIGGAAGATAGAALGPAGAVVGGVVGSAIGGAVGGAIGRQLGDLVDGPDLPSDAIAPGEILESPPPPFTGGQGFNVLYRVTVYDDTFGVREVPDLLPGPIGDVTVLREAADGDLDFGFRYGPSPQQEQGIINGVDPEDEVNAAIVSAVRADGQPDTDGDLQLDPIRRSAPRAAPALTPVSPAQAPAPAPAPSPTSPAQAPSPVPAGDAPPALQPAPQPEEAPATTPDNTPALLPVPLPMPAASSGPKGATGTATAPRTEIDDPTKNQTTPPPGKQKQYPTNAGGCGCNTPIIKNQQTILANQQAATQTQQADLSGIRSQLARIEGNQVNPVTGFAALQTGQVGLLGVVNTLKSFLEKAWETTRIQKVLNVLTFIAVMHNVAMLSRDVAETFGWVASQALQVVGIEDEEGNAIDVYSWFTGSIESLLVAMFGQELVNDARVTWQKANSIIRSASMIIWTMRGILDATQDLMEWVAENTGKIGNALKRFGVVGEKAYPWMSERAQARNRIRSRFEKVSGALENAEDKASSFSMATGSILEIQDETDQLTGQFVDFRESVLNGVPDPWDDNEPVDVVENQGDAISQSPPVSANDADRG